MRSELRGFFKWWKLYLTVLLPFLLLPVPLIYQYPEVKCAYILVIMAVYWMFETLPLAVTSLLPVVLVPMFGIMDSKSVTPNYLKDTNMLFLGGLMMAICIENWSLHKRIALKVLQLVGTKPRWLMFGFMLPTWFLSMWISNTATTAMMVPIVGAVLQQIKAGSERTSDRYRNDVMLNELEDGTNKINLGLINEAVVPAEGLQRVATAQLELAKDHSVSTPTLNTGIDTKSELSSNLTSSRPTLGHTTADSQATLVSRSNLTSQSQDDLVIDKEDDPQFVKLCKAMFLCIAYAANAGGISTLTGTPPNLVLIGQLRVLFDGDTGVNFSTWIAFALPVSFIVLCFCWLWLQIYFLGFKSTFKGCCDCRETEVDIKIKAVISEEYRRLGKMTWAQTCSLIFFILLALLWLTRSPKFMPGWGDLFVDSNGKSYVTDATAAIFISIILFIVPSEMPNCNPRKKIPKNLLDWETLTHKMPWNILLLLGGGFAIADASQKSGLSQWIGVQLAALSSLPTWVMVLIITTIIAMLTEVTSNTATATLMLPILANMAETIQLNPLYLMLPATVAASFAFMLPVATPPNAIVFASGHLRIKDMALAGIVMNIIAILVVTMGVCTWGQSLFILEAYPSWAKQIANTTLAPTLSNVTSGL